jgi:hypothetical protein
MATSLENPTNTTYPLAGFLGTVIDLLKQLLETLKNPVQDEKPVKS